MILPSNVKKLGIWAGIFIAFAAVGPLSAIPSPQSTAPALDQKAVEAVIAERLQAGELIGVSLAVARDGRVVWAKGYGKASLTGNVPATAETMFAIGSLTKQFTAAGILLLAEDGKLAVSDKVAKYYPRLTRASDITLLDLMNHVSGYTDYYPLDFVDRRMLKPRSVDWVIDAYGTQKLDFEPGSRYSYSNTGYLILGRVIEKVSGEPYGKFLSRRILKPLGLAHTLYEPDPREPGFASGYTAFALGPLEKTTPEAKGWIATAGALYSTASDLVRWDLALAGGKVLKPDSFKLMTSPRKLNDGRLSGYGCGLSIGERNGAVVLAHNGAVSGFLAYNFLIPATGSALAILINDEAGSEAAKVYRPILPSLYPPASPAAAKPEAQPAPKPAPAPPAKPDVPAIAGPSAGDEAQAFFLRLQSGRIDRAELGEEFSWYLTEAKIRGAAARLKPYGEPQAATVLSTGERGGMEVASVDLKFPSGTLRVLMYRTPDGKIQQFFVGKA